MQLQLRNPRFIIIGLAAVLVASLSGCATDSMRKTAGTNTSAIDATLSKNATQIQNTLPSNASAGNSGSRTLSQSTSRDNPLLQSWLTLPDGTIIRASSADSVTWKDIVVSVRVTSLPGTQAGTNPYPAIVGNHASIINHWDITTPAGPGTLVYFERTPPAAARSSKVTDEYEAIVYGTQYAYVMDAVVTGDLSLAKPEILSLLKGWYVPAVFNDEAPWAKPDAGYSQGIVTTKTPEVPPAFEMSFLPREGLASIVASRGYGTVRANKSWTETTWFSGSPLVINGIQYTIPSEFKGKQMVVLPIKGGIVWVPTNGQHFTHPNLTGSTSIYFTPYHSTNGSITDGVSLLAKVPHKWLGFDGPVVASAWSSWLPKSEVAMPKVKSEIVRQLTFHTDNTVKSDVQHTRPFTSLWPSLFDRVVPKTPTGKPAYAADVQSLRRTEGGFVLQVGFVDAKPDGRNAGMQGQGAYYYWSVHTKKWTPLTQLYGVQTIAGDLSAGSQAVYWEETVPSDQTNGLDVAQMYYNPSTNTIRSVWLGNWFFSGSFVDVSSWVTVLSNHVKPAGQQPLWTVYTP